MPPLIRVPEATDPEAALAAVVAIRRAAAQLELDAVAHAIAQGWTWADVGHALGISAQAAHKKFSAAAQRR